MPVRRHPIIVNSNRIHRQPIFINPYIEYISVRSSDRFKNFCLQYEHISDCKSALYFRYLILNNLGRDVLEKILHSSFAGIYFISEEDDGYVKINDNQKLKLGKLIIKVATDFGIDTTNKDELIGIEKFIDQYKSWFKMINNLSFKILKGNDILSGYTSKNYISNHGMLSGSCMNDKKNILKLYENNEEKVELLILVDGTDKIHGRALIWKLDNRSFSFMDRVYGSDNYVVNIFHRYAKEKGMAYRSQEQEKNFKIYLNDKTVKNANKFPLKVKLKTKNLMLMPYMDSIFIWNKRNNVFSNKPVMLTKYSRLRCTDGHVEDELYNFF